MEKKLTFETKAGEHVHKHIINFCQIQVLCFQMFNNIISFISDLVIYHIYTDRIHNQQAAWLVLTRRRVYDRSETLQLKTCLVSAAGNIKTTASFIC